MGGAACGNPVSVPLINSNPQIIQDTRSDTNAQYLEPGYGAKPIRSENEPYLIYNTAIGNCEAFDFSGPTNSIFDLAKILNQATKQARNYIFNFTINLVSETLEDGIYHINVSSSDCSLSGPN